MNFQNKRVVVTGVAGFIGSNLADKLLELGAEVIGIDNLLTGRKENLALALNNTNFKFFQGDIRDLDFLLEIFKDIDIIFHQAAFTSVPQSILMPKTCNDINVDGILNILNVARKRDIENIVSASSAAVYGDDQTLPKKEDMLCTPISPYGVSKLAGEMYMQSYYHSYGLKTKSLRYFNVFGPKQRDSAYSGVIAIWFGNVVRNEDVLVYGDGMQTRDFIYIKDIVHANLLASESKVWGEVFNIGSGIPINLNTLAELIIKITNKANLKIKYKMQRNGDILHSYCDNNKAKEILKFIPTYNLEEGLKNYYKYLLDNKISLI
ncbi:MAG: NAD-dependent epimerase/dehydratase family protein [Candidatus Lokiarchaeota archaeon]|nr:NAD-dependent epimerase/dehydratase family protein [Candidatus Lokiarchaeota archaeon]